MFGLFFIFNSLFLFGRAKSWKKFIMQNQVLQNEICYLKNIYIQNSQVINEMQKQNLILESIFLGCVGFVYVAIYQLKI